MLTGSARHVLNFADHFIFRNTKLVYLIPLLPSIISSITLAICFKTAFANNRFPDWVTTPFISFTGVNYPESNVFAYGLTLSGISLLFVNHIFTTKLMTNKRIIDTNHFNFFLNLIMDNYICCYMQTIIHSIIDYILSYFLIIAAIAVSLQSWINTNNEMAMQFLSPSMQSMTWFDDKKTAIHIIAAGVFFFGFILVHNIVVVLTFNYRGNAWLRYSFYYKLLTLSVSMCAGLLLFWSIFWCSYIADPISSESMYRFGLNTIGFCQYLVTICDCLFCVSFAFDFAIAEKKKIE